jgi:NADPH-dependent ferric siderophore reductase
VEERAFATRVVRASRLSPTFVRVTVTGDSLAEFAGHGFDQRINLAFVTDPAQAAAYDADEDWYATWQETSVERRPPLRTYTVRSFRPADAELDLDFVLHGDAGPASRFAAAARPGMPLTVCGPVVGHTFPASADVAWAPPPDAGRMLIAADEAAVPAASAIAEALPPGASATVVLEVPEPADAVPFAAPAGVDVVWLARSRGERLSPVVREIVAALPSAPPVPLPDSGEDEDELWDVPDTPPAGGFYAWLAGEAGAVVGMRRHLVGERGIDRRAVAFMGYWRRGRAQVN